MKVEYMVRTLRITLMIAFWCLSSLSLPYQHIFVAFPQTKTSDVYKKIAPSTVLIRTNEGGGTGFIVSSDGLIVTALHVVEGASDVAIKTQQGVTYNEVILLAKDERRDIAILKVAASSLPAVVLADEELSPGDEVIVIGNPLAVEELQVSVSTGILSGIRNLNKDTKVLQITAPISPGNSGGPVLSKNGKVIGVISFKLVKGEALNFAIPIVYAQNLIAQSAVANPLMAWKASGRVPFGGQPSLELPSKKPPMNLSGKWKPYNYNSTWYIKDDGHNVQIYYDPGAIYGGVMLIYEGVWEGDIIVGLELDQSTRFVMKPIKENLLRYTRFDRGPNLKDSREKVLTKARKVASKIPNEGTAMWTRVIE